MIAILVSSGLALVITGFSIPWLISRQLESGIGQQIREDGPSRHLVKAGTPTMGGVGVIIAVVVAYLVIHLHMGVGLSRSGLLVIGVTIASGAVGLIDDLLKVARRRNLGLSKTQKFSGQFAVAIAFALLARYWAHIPTAISFVRLSGLSIQLGSIGWCVFAVFVIVATSNAVNLTDGLDGLAAGSSIFAFAAVALISYWIFRHSATYQIHDGLDLAVLAICFVGGLAGFLWWNAPPAKIFMGDVGSLALGSGLGAFALVLHLDLFLILLGGLFVVETLSVIGQVFSFRVFHRRILKMAPIHHHFELIGWPETTVLIRLWIAAGVLTAIAIGAFYADFLSLGVIGH
ncbi:MAG: phospho-N-acetylmuramoyl-pentapeptide-transferase [Ferrimicrobium sp.]